MKTSFAVFTLIIKPAYLTYHIALLDVRPFIQQQLAYGQVACVRGQHTKRSHVSLPGLRICQQAPH